MDKDVMMKQKTDRFSPELFTAISDLAESLERSEAVLCYSEANQALMMDRSALELITEAGELQRKVYAGDSAGEDLEDNLACLHELQNDISTNVVIQEQSIARETAVAFLQDMNQEISQMLGFDFASLTRRPGGCC